MNPSMVLRALILGLLVGVLLAAPTTAMDMRHWDPIPPEDLALTENPAEPGASAMYLFRRAEISYGSVTYFYEHGALKLFNESGLEKADLLFPQQEIRIVARTVKPDGSAIQLDQKEFRQRTVIKSSWGKRDMTVFSFPQVSPGVILEYKVRYELGRADRRFFRWPFQADAYCRESSIAVDNRFLEHRSRIIIDRYRQAAVERGKAAARSVYIARNLPALPDEELLPPKSMSSVHFLLYLVKEAVRGSGLTRINTPEGRRKHIARYWEQHGEEVGKRLLPQLKPNKAIRKLLAGIDPEGLSREKLPKAIYDHVQREFRNTTFKTRTDPELESRTEKQKREEDRDLPLLKHVIQEGRGSANQLTYLTAALLRAAGFEALPAFACGRDDGIFEEGILYDQFYDPLVAVPVEGGYSYLDPGRPYCPYGELSWYKQGVATMVYLDRSGQRMQTPVLPPGGNRFERRMEVTLSDLDLTGEFQWLYRGSPALDRRNDWDDDSPEEQKEDIQSQLEKAFSGVEIEDTSVTNLRDPDRDLIVKGRLLAPDQVVRAGSRLLLPIAQIGRIESHRFTAESRRLPVAMRIPFLAIDQVTCPIPEGYRVAELPPPMRFENSAGAYALVIQEKEDSVVCRRNFLVRSFFLTPEGYPALKELYDEVRTGDSTNVMLVEE